MKNFDVVILFHPNQSERVPEMVERYIKQITESGGEVHLSQDLERKKIHYTLKRFKSSKAHFVIINATMSDEAMSELRESFRFNDVIMRNLITCRREPRTERLIPLLEKDERPPFSRNSRPTVAKNFHAGDVYLNIAFLRDNTLPAGRIMPARVTGLSSKAQKQLTLAIKWARYLGLMCYCDRHA